MYISINTSILSDIDEQIINEHGDMKLDESIIDDTRRIASSLDSEIVNLLVRIKAVEQKASKLQYALSEYVSAHDYLKEHIGERYAHDRMQEAFINLSAAILNNN